MIYRRTEAKDYARTHMKGIWAAALVPFNEDLSIDETGFRRNLRHWVDDLGIDGIFIAGKQSEFFSMSMAERKRSMDITVDEIGNKAGVIASCSDQNMDTVIELAKHAQAIGAPYIVVHAPVLHFLGQAGRDALPVLQDHQRAGRHRHRDVEPRGLRLPDEPGALRAHRRTAEHRRDQVQRAARDVCAAVAHGRRQDSGQHRVRGRVVRQHRRTELASLSVFVAAVSVPDQSGPPDARLHRSRVQGRGREGQGDPRQPQSGA